MSEHKPPAVVYLSDKQREVLDLVVARKSSKEIARILNISKPTVDQRIASARAKYGASSRNELVAQYLAGSALYDQITYDPIHLPLCHSVGDFSPQVAASGPVFSVADVAGFVPSYSAPDRPSLPRPLETLDKMFGVWGRLGAVGLLSALIAISLLALLSIAQTLSELL